MNKILDDAVEDSQRSARLHGKAVEGAILAMTQASEKMSQAEEEIQKLREKLAEYEESFKSIYFHSGRFSARNWDIVPRSHLGATLKLINKECERVVPSLNKFSEE